MDPITAVILVVGVIVALVLLAILVNVVSANLIRQAAYYREYPGGDFNTARLNALTRQVKR